MGMVKLAGVASLLLAGHVFAQSIVNYTVELSPYNAPYRDTWKATGGKRFFTDTGLVSGTALGNANNDQEYTVGSIITWSLNVNLNPNTTHVGTPGAGFKPCGLANFVFNLELQRDMPNPQPNQAVPLGVGSMDDPGWFSAMNDGTGSTTSNWDPVAHAAFTLVFNVSGKGPGRIIDQNDDAVGPARPAPDTGTSKNADGGPNAPVFSFPTHQDGKLLGMGAGYDRWDNLGGTTEIWKTTAGIGLLKVPQLNVPENQWPNGLGHKALCEGQINTSGLSPGTYILKATPGTGVNVLRGDVDPYQHQADAFAVAADQVNGDEISFILVDPPSCTIPAVVSAVSQRTHSGFGTPQTFDIDLPMTGGAGSEPRQNGPTKVVVTYNTALDQTVIPSVSLSAKSTQGGATVAAPALGAVTVSGSTVTINTTGALNRSCISITINGAKSSAGNCVQTTAKTFKVRYNLGDVDGSLGCLTGDVNAVRARANFQIPTADTFWNDLNCNNRIETGDVNLVRGAVGALITSPCNN